MAGININELDKNLENEFARIGFDLKDLMGSAKYVDEHVIMMSKKVDSNTVLNLEDQVICSFAVINSRRDRQCYIEQVHASLLRNVPASDKYETLVEINYWCYNGPLPTKEQICNEMAGVLKLGEIKAKFGLNKNDSGLTINQKKTRNKKGL